MAVSLPYLASYKNVGKLFENIATAKVPPKFTHQLFADTTWPKERDRPSPHTAAPAFGLR